jgi:hypothetical protein
MSRAKKDKTEDKTEEKPKRGYTVTQRVLDARRAASARRVANQLANKKIAEALTGSASKLKQEDLETSSDTSEDEDAPPSRSVPAAKKAVEKPAPITEQAVQTASKTAAESAAKASQSDDSDSSSDDERIVISTKSKSKKSKAKPKEESPLPAEEEVVATKRGRGRPRIPDKPIPAAEPEEEPEKPRWGPGRPKKVIDPEVIKAEAYAIAKAKYKARYKGKLAGMGAVPAYRYAPEPQPKVIREVVHIKQQPTIADHMRSGIIKEML